MTPLTVGQLRRALDGLPDEQAVFGLEPSWGINESVLLLEL